LAEDQVVISYRGREMWRVSLFSATGTEDARHCGCHVVRLLRCSVVRARLRPGPCYAISHDDHAHCCRARNLDMVISHYWLSTRSILLLVSIIPAVCELWLCREKCKLHTKNTLRRMLTQDPSDRLLLWPVSYVIQDSLQDRIPSR
jgi:hypothetical protein